MKPLTRPPGVPDLSKYPLRLRPRHLAEIFGISQRSIATEVARGNFPIPRLTREKSLAFSLQDVRDYFADRTFEPLDKSA